MSSILSSAEAVKHLKKMKVSPKYEKFPEIVLKTFTFLIKLSNYTVRSIFDNKEFYLLLFRSIYCVLHLKPRCVIL